jgi:hypothetical protein
MEKFFSNFENIKTNSIKSKHNSCSTLSSNLIEVSTTVIENKAFIGFSENDKDLIKNLSSNKNNSLYVKNNINALNSICCGDKIYIGYTDFSNLNDDTNFHVKGDSEINGNLYVYDDIVVNKNLYTCCNLNVGFDNINDINNDDNYILNINGKSCFKDNIYVAKSILIEDNIVANKESYLNSIYLNTNIKLDKEIIDDIDVNNFSDNDKLLIINNIIHSLNNLKDFDFKGIIFNQGNDSFNNSIVSISKKFIINKQKYYAFLLVNILSHPKIKNIIKNPINDSFTIIDSDFNKIGFNSSLTDYNNLKNAIILYVKPNLNINNYNQKNPSKNLNSSSKNIHKINNNKINKKKFNINFISNFDIFNKLKNFTSKLYNNDSDEYELE